MQDCSSLLMQIYQFCVIVEQFSKFVMYLIAVN
jgi:hypothetical protein